LINFIDAARLSVNAIFYAGIIWRKLVLKFLIRIGNEIINRCSTFGDEVKEVIAFAPLAVQIYLRGVILIKDLTNMTALDLREYSR
jgi:replicative DNA helicase